MAGSKKCLPGCDYDAERKRVDEQNKVIADIARALALKNT